MLKRNNILGSVLLLTVFLLTSEAKAVLSWWGLDGLVILPHTDLFNPTIEYSGYANQAWLNSPPPFYVFAYGTPKWGPNGIDMDGNLHTIADWHTIWNHGYTTPKLYTWGFFLDPPGYDYVIDITTEGNDATGDLLAIDPADLANLEFGPSFFSVNGGQATGSFSAPTLINTDMASIVSFFDLTTGDPAEGDWAASLPLLQNLAGGPPGQVLISVAQFPAPVPVPEPLTNLLVFASVMVLGLSVIGRRRRSRTRLTPRPQTTHAGSL